MFTCVEHVQGVAACFRVLLCTLICVCFACYMRVLVTICSSCPTIYDVICSLMYIKLFVFFLAVFHLDADVLISCSDLAFSFSVWKSTQKSLVGFFPRIVR
ncbi:hypothetical protein EON63_06895 [archaeon]|nr:MAG: hypothetical protein EON63_06895 [archaeon]